MLQHNRPSSLQVIVHMGYVRLLGGDQLITKKKQSLKYATQNKKIGVNNLRKNV